MTVSERIKVEFISDVADGVFGTKEDAEKAEILENIVNEVCEHYGTRPAVYEVVQFILMNYKLEKK